MNKDIVFPKSFDFDVSEKIIKESEQGDCYACALAMAVRYNIDSEIYVQSDIGHGNVEVDKDEVTITIDEYYDENSVGNESIFFTFNMSDELEKWVNDFDNGKYVPPITVETIIETENIEANMIYGQVNGKMSIKDYAIRDIVWQLVKRDEHMIENDEGKYIWKIDTELINSGKVKLPNTYPSEKVNEYLETYTGFSGEYEWREKDNENENETSWETLISDAPNYECPWEWTELRWRYKD